MPFSSMPHPHAFLARQSSSRDFADRRHLPVAAFHLQTNAAGAQCERAPRDSNEAAASACFSLAYCQCDFDSSLAAIVWALVNMLDMSVPSSIDCFSGPAETSVEPHEAGDMVATAIFKRDKMARGKKAAHSIEPHSDATARIRVEARPTIQGYCTRESCTSRPGRALAKSVGCFVGEPEGCEEGARGPGDSTRRFVGH